MKTIEEIRRERLAQLVAKHGSLMELCEALGYARTQTAGIGRILNANIRHDRDGKPYVMGSAMAREVEAKLGLDHGWMDSLQSYTELFGPDDSRTKVLLMMESMPADQWSTVVRLVDAVTQPPLKTGTNEGA
jgi:hypothetical protein